MLVKWAEQKMQIFMISCKERLTMISSSLRVGAKPVRHSNSTIFAGSENSTANIAIVAHERFESNKSKDNNTE